MILANPLRYGWHRRSRRRRVRRNAGRRVPSWLRLLRARRGRRNPFRRRRSRRRTFSFRSNPPMRRRSRSRRRSRRHNPWVRFFATGSRRRGRGRRRRNPDTSIVGAVQSGLRPSRIKDNLTDGVQGALGWAGTSLLTNLENRFLGLDRLTGALGGGWIQKILGYVVRGVNVGILAGLTSRFVSGETRRNLVFGGVTSIGVSVINDVAPLLGGPGAAVQGLLKSGMGDYVLAAGPYATAMKPFGVGDYLLANGQPFLPYAPNQPVYGGDDPYGTF